MNFIRYKYHYKLFKKIISLDFKIWKDNQLIFDIYRNESEKILLLRIVLFNLVRLMCKKSKPYTLSIFAPIARKRPSMFS